MGHVFCILVMTKIIKGLLLRSRAGLASGVGIALLRCINIILVAGLYLCLVEVCMCLPVSVHEFDAVWAHRIMGWKNSSWVAGSRAGSTQSVQARETLQNTHKHTVLNRHTRVLYTAIVMFSGVATNIIKVLTWHRLLLIIWN